MKIFPPCLTLLLGFPILTLAGTPDISSVAAKNPNPPQEAADLPDARPEWTLSAGPQWRQIGEAQFKGGSRAGRSHLPAAPKGGGGLSTGYADGYVLPDSSGGAQTWNWGYRNASQVSGDFLSFSSRSSELISRTVSNSFSTDWSDDLSNVGFFLLLESPTVVQWKHLSLSAALGYSFVQDDTSSESLAFRAIRSSHLRTRDVTDWYDISAIAPVPPAPHSGNFNGPGPVISLTPARSLGGGVREQSLGSEVFTSHLRQSLELQLHTLSLGPRASFQFGSLRVLAGLGFALNIVPWDAESSETLRSNKRGTLQTWRDDASGTEVLAGTYVELGSEWRFAKSWSLSAGVRYDWSQKLEGSLGGTEFEVDLGGWTAMLGVGFRF